MEPADLTIEILKDIRDEGRKTNQRLEQTNERLEQTNERLDTTNEKLDALWTRQTETELRLATELASVGGAVREVRDLLRQDRELRDRVDDHERRLSAVERRTG